MNFPFHEEHSRRKALGVMALKVFNAPKLRLVIMRPLPTQVLMKFRRQNVNYELDDPIKVVLMASKNLVNVSCLCLRYVIRSLVFGSTMV